MAVALTVLRRAHGAAAVRFAGPLLALFALIVGQVEGGQYAWSQARLVAGEAGAGTSRANATQADRTAAFLSYVRTHGRRYMLGSAEYAMRNALFEARFAAVEEHNSRPNRTWTAGVNRLSDWTEEELAALRGYRRGARSLSRAPVDDMRLHFVGQAGAPWRRNASHLPQTFSWAPTLAVTREVMDQQGCGSCWAFASAATMRAHSELYQQDKAFSPQQIVSCVQNPHHCGGDGGCKGGTAELAMDYASRVGLTTEKDFRYTGEDERCPACLKDGAVRGCGLLSLFAGRRETGMTGWKRLPENKLQPLKLALVERGPVAVSVSTYTKWNMYESGILDTCSDEFEDNEFNVNHAVMLVGYGVEERLNYWQIQNSWGSDWGENGFMRIQREKDDDTEAKKCGWDDKPQEGTGCQGGPSKVMVCGSCGMLYDNVIPEFNLNEKGWWHTHGRRPMTLGKATSLLSKSATVPQ